MSKLKWKIEIEAIEKAIKLVFPQNRKEMLFLCGTMAFYLSYSFYLVIYTNIMEFPYYDSYFNFDITPIINDGYPNLVSHPLLIFLTKPIVLIGNLISILSGNDKAKFLFIAIFCSYLITSSIMYITRYLREIIGLNKLNTSIITIYYLLFSTNLILSFSFESFTYTSFILSYGIYYYSLKIKEQKNSPISVNTIFCLTLGGITLTNFFKGIILVCFTQKKINSLIRQFIVIGLFFSVLLCFLAVILYTNYDDNIVDKINGRYAFFSSLSENTSFINKTLNFLGSPILHGKINKQQVLFDEPTIVLDVIVNKYSYQLWQKIYIIILMSLVAISIFINRSKKQVLVIFFLFSIDLFIHIVFQFGSHEPYIYGGHWVYTIPVLLGWLYKSIPIKKISYSYTIVLVVMTIILCYNNLKMLSQFISTSTEIYPIK